MCNNFNVQQRLVYCGKPNIWIYWFILALWSPIRVLGRHWFGIMSLMMHYLNKCLIIISIAPSLGTLSVDIPITHVPYYHNDPQQQGWNGQWHYKIIYRASTHLHTSCSVSKLQVAIDFSRFHSKSHQIFGAILNDVIWSNKVICYHQHPKELHRLNLKLCSKHRGCWRPGTFKHKYICRHSDHQIEVQDI